MKKVLLIAALIAVILVLGIACKTNTTENKHNTNNSVDHNQQQNANFNPENMPPQIKNAYKFAADNRDLLKNFYCVCGCMGPMHDPRHKNLAQCFVQEIKANGQIIYDPHGSTCKACLDENLDVSIWKEKGIKLEQMLKDYDAKYGQAPGAIEAKRYLKK